MYSHPGAGLGLLARETAGVPRELATILIFFFVPAPSDISPAVASPSLPDPTAILERRRAFAWGRGVPDRLPVAIVEFFFGFFLVDSFPLDSERAGEPARFRDLLFLPVSACLCLSWGVVTPFGAESLFLSFISAELSLASASFFSSSLLPSSSSDDSSPDFS